MLSSPNKTRLLDTNVFLRFITNDHPVLSTQAKKFFKAAEEGSYRIYLDELVLGEIIWTLQSFYEYSKHQIFSRLSKLLSSRFITNPRKKTIIKALALYSTSRLSFSDAWVSEISRRGKMRLETFDKALQKLT